MGTVTIDLKLLALVVIGIGLVILIGYLIVLVRNMVKTVKHTNKLLEDAQVISNIAAKRTEEVDKVVDDMTESLGNVAKAMKGQQDLKKAFATLINAVSALKNIISKTKKEE